jgi:hypothetical protein
MTTRKLRLGPLPNQETLKVTITLSASLREELEDYARVYGQTFGQTVDLASLIPHMLTTFVARDRGFQRLRSMHGATAASEP